MGLHEDFYLDRLPIHREQSDVPEALAYSDDPITSYESTHGVPYTAEKLGYNENFKLDPMVEMKVRAIDEYIQKTIETEGMRNSKTGYMTVFNRLAAHMGDTFEAKMRAGEQRSVLDSMFYRVSVDNRMSSQTYLKEFTKQYNIRRVETLKQQLRDGLAALV